MSPQSNYGYRENVSSSVGLTFRFPRLVTFRFPCLVNQSNVSKPPIQNGGTENMSPQSNYGYRENVSSSVGLTLCFPRSQIEETFSRYLQFKMGNWDYVSTIKLWVPRKYLFNTSFGNIKVPSFGQPINCLKNSCQPINFFVWKKCIKNSSLINGALS